MDDDDPQALWLVFSRYTLGGTRGGGGGPYSPAAWGEQNKLTLTQYVAICRDAGLLHLVDQAELSNIFSSHAYQASAYSLPKLDYLGFLKALQALQARSQGSDVPHAIARLAASNPQPRNGTLMSQQVTKPGASARWTSNEYGGAGLQQLGRDAWAGAGGPVVTTISPHTPGQVPAPASAAASPGGTLLLRPQSARPTPAVGQAKGPAPGNQGLSTAERQKAPSLQQLQWPQTANIPVTGMATSGEQQGSLAQNHAAMLAGYTLGQAPLAVPASPTTASLPAGSSQAQASSGALSAAGAAPGAPMSPPPPAAGDLHKASAGNLADGNGADRGAAGKAPTSPPPALVTQAPGASPPPAIAAHSPPATTSLAVALPAAGAAQATHGQVPHTNTQHQPGGRPPLPAGSSQQAVRAGAPVVSNSGRLPPANARPANARVVREAWGPGANSSAGASALSIPRAGSGSLEQALAQLEQQLSGHPSRNGTTPARGLSAPAGSAGATQQQGVVDSSSRPPVTGGTLPPVPAIVAAQAAGMARPAVPVSNSQEMRLTSLEGTLGAIHPQIASLLARMDVLERTQQLAIAMAAAPGASLSLGVEGGPAGGEAAGGGGGGGGGLSKAALMDTLRTLQEQMQVMQSQSGAMAAMQVSLQQDMARINSGLKKSAADVAQISMAQAQADLTLQDLQLQVEQLQMAKSLNRTGKSDLALADSEGLAQAELGAALADHEAEAKRAMAVKLEEHAAQVKARMADLERRAAAAMEAAAAAEREQRTVAAQLQEQQAALAARLDELSSRTTAAQEALEQVMAEASTNHLGEGDGPAPALVHWIEELKRRAAAALDAAAAAEAEQRATAAALAQQQEALQKRLEELNARAQTAANEAAVLKRANSARIASTSMESLLPLEQSPTLRRGGRKDNIAVGIAEEASITASAARAAAASAEAEVAELKGLLLELQGKQDATARAVLELDLGGLQQRIEPLEALPARLDSAEGQLTELQGLAVRVEELEEEVASGMSASMQTSMMQGLTTRMDTLTQLVDQVVLLTQELEQKVEGGDKEGGGEGSAEGGDGAGGSGGEGEGGEGMAAAGVTEEQGGAGGEGSAGPGAAAAGSSNVSWGGDSDLGRQGSQPRKNSRYTAQGLVRSEAQDVRRRMAEIRQRMASNMGADPPDGVWQASGLGDGSAPGMFRPAMLGTRPSVDGSLVDGGGSMMMMMVPGGAMGGGGVPVMVSGEELVELRSKVEELGLRVPDLTLLQKITEQVSALAQGLDAAEKGVSFLKGRVKELEARPSATDQVVQLLNGLKLHQGALLVLKERLDNLEDPLAVSNNRVYKEVFDQIKALEERTATALQAATTHINPALQAVTAIAAAATQGGGGSGKLGQQPQYLRNLRQMYSSGQGGPSLSANLAANAALAGAGGMPTLPPAMQPLSLGRSTRESLTGLALGLAPQSPSPPLSPGMGSGNLGPRMSGMMGAAPAAMAVAAPLGSRASAAAGSPAASGGGAVAARRSVAESSGGTASSGAGPPGSKSGKQRPSLADGMSFRLTASRRLAGQQPL